MLIVITTRHWKQKSSQCSYFIKAALTLIIEKGETVISKVCQERHSFCQGWNVEEDIIKSEHFLLRTTLLQFIQTLEHSEFILWIFEKVPVGSKNSVNLLEAWNKIKVINQQLTALIVCFLPISLWIKLSRARSWVMSLLIDNDSKCVFKSDKSPTFS